MFELIWYIFITAAYPTKGDDTVALFELFKKMQFWITILKLFELILIAAPMYIYELLKKWKFNIDIYELNLSK